MDNGIHGVAVCPLGTLKKVPNGPKTLGLFEVLWGKTFCHSEGSEESGLVSGDSELYLSEVKDLAQKVKQLILCLTPQFLIEPKIAFLAQSGILGRTSLRGYRETRRSGPHPPTPSPNFGRGGVFPSKIFDF